MIKNIGPTIHNGESIYNTGAGGGGGDLPEKFTPVKAVYRKWRVNISNNPYLPISQAYTTNCKFIFKGAIDPDILVNNQGTNDLGIFGDFSYSNLLWGASIRVIPTLPSYCSINLRNGVNLGWNNFIYSYDELIATKEIEISWDAANWAIKFDDVLKGSGTLGSWTETTQTSSSPDVNAGIYTCYPWGGGSGYPQMPSQIGIKKISCIDNNTNKLLFNLLSCKRNADNYYGLYEAVSGLFYTSEDNSNRIGYME